MLSKGEAILSHSVLLLMEKEVFHKAAMLFIATHLGITPAELDEGMNNHLSDGGNAKLEMINSLKNDLKILTEQYHPELQMHIEGTILNDSSDK